MIGMSLLGVAMMAVSLSFVDMDGEVVIGEGIKDDAPGIFKGEQLGTWVPGSPQFDIALDPIDGTRAYVCGLPTWASWPRATRCRWCRSC